ncbi:TIGR00730 family Rossman fold protein [Campylobacter fetus]|nr:TIGR00730 family Rossman fold protein [Campylobacter fetus]QMS69462.1 TIGR00730 family Rossman fold protein [Campylobacter fetus]QNH10580.1 TIGR00730 family Rossman fold protein [Campylobacter fetus]
MRYNYAKNRGSILEFVTIFGSARLDSGSKFYKIAFELGKKLSQAGYGVVTGGGGGIMEAANKGAFLSGGVSVGINIILPFEQKLNPYCTESKTIDNLSKRKDMLIEKSSAFILMPGGFGTLDEIFEVITLAQTGLRKHKIVFCCKEFWQPLLDFFDNTLAAEKLIADDHSVYAVIDDFDEIIRYLKD